MWHFCLRAPLNADRVLLQTNSKKYFRKIIGLLAVKTVLSHFITFKEHMPNKADTTCSQRTSKNISRKRVLIQQEQLELLTLFYVMLPVVSRIK